MFSHLRARHNAGVEKISTLARQRYCVGTIRIDSFSSEYIATRELHKYIFASQRIQVIEIAIGEGELV